jgi:hypothetical protein
LKHGANEIVTTYLLDKEIDALELFSPTQKNLERREPRLEYTDNDEAEVYYAQIMYLVASEGACALRKERRRRKDLATVDGVGQPRSEVIAQEGVERAMP